jgi:iron complex transport system ATP-binding protein
VKGQEKDLVPCLGIAQNCKYQLAFIENVNRAPIIEMRNVNVRKQDSVLLSDVNLRIEAGEKLAIIGPNGSGKSSLVKVMTGEFWHDASTPGAFVKLMGKEHWDLFDVRRAFGYVSSDLQYEFKREIPCLDAVISGAFGSIGTNRSHDIDERLRERALEALRKVESAHLAPRAVASLSTGEARRVLMARAMVNDPMALILDEPMTSLDLIGKGIVMEAMRSLAKSGRALVLVTHDPSEIPPEVERVVMMKHGRIFVDSDASALNQENLRALYEVPLRLKKVEGRYLVWS